jgi:hypothetical protein
MNPTTRVGPGVITGRVLRAANDAPLKNVEVQLFDEHQRTHIAHSKTDSNGHFELDGLVSGRYSLLIRHNPYVPTARALSLIGETEIRDLEFRLVASGAFVGKVEDEDGNLLSGVEVQALVKTSVVSQWAPEDLSSVANLDMVPLARAITNDRGEYRLYGLPPGEYFLSAIDTGMPHMTESALTGGFMVSPSDVSRTKYPPIYFPGTTEKAKAVSTQLTAGQEKEVGIHLQRFPSRKIIGQTVGLDGKPAEGVFISLMPLDMATLFSGFPLGNKTDQQGRFEIDNVPPEEYFVRATRVKFSEEERSFSVARVDVRERDVSGLNLVLSHGQMVSGKVLCSVNPTFDMSDLHLWLTPVNEEAHHIHTGAAHVKADGTFSTRELAETTYRIHFTGLPEDWYLKAARVAGDDILRSGLVISRDAISNELEVEISPEGARIEATVLKDGRPVPGAIAILTLPPEIYHRYMNRAICDQYGQFEFHGIPPGPCQLNMSAAPPELVMSEDDSRNLTRTSLSISVDRGERRVLTVIL